MARTTPPEREVATLLIPRALITAVLALDAVRAMPYELAFLTPLAFAVILLTIVLCCLPQFGPSDLILEVPSAAVVPERSGTFPA